MSFDALRIWFLTGSQDLYGEVILAKVLQQSKEIVAGLSAAPDVPIEIVHREPLVIHYWKANCQKRLEGRHLRAAPRVRDHAGAVPRPTPGVNTGGGRESPARQSITPSASRPWTSTKPSDS